MLSTGPLVRPSDKSFQSALPLRRKDRLGAQAIDRPWEENEDVAWSKPRALAAFRKALDLADSRQCQRPLQNKGHPPPGEGVQLLCQWPAHCQACPAPAD